MDTLWTTASTRMIGVRLSIVLFHVRWKFR